MSHSFSRGQYRRGRVSGLSSTGTRTRLIDSFTVRQIAIHESEYDSRQDGTRPESTDWRIPASGLFAV